MPRRVHAKSNVVTPPPLGDGTQVSVHDLYRMAKFAKPLRFSYFKKRATSHNGGHIASIRGRGMEFDEVRTYQPGDDIRTIDWRVTARTNKPHTKLYHEERERPVYCIVDYRASMYFGTRVAFKSVIAAQLAATFAWTAVQQGDRLGGMIFTDEAYYEIRPQNKHRGIMPFLKLLASTPLQRFSPEKATPALSKTFERLRHVVKPGSVLFLISDFAHYDEQCEKHLSYLSRHNECFACRIRDPLEIALPPDNYYVVGNQDEHTSIDTSNKRLTEDFHKYQSYETYTLQKSLHDRRIPLLNFRTDSDPNVILRQTFGKHQSRGRRA